MIGVFHACTREEREELLAIFGRVATFPANHAAFEASGSDGRVYSVAHMGSWIVTYWVDPDRVVVRFVEVESAS